MTRNVVYDKEGWSQKFYANGIDTFSDILLPGVKCHMAWKCGSEAIFICSEGAKYIPEECMIIEQNLWSGPLYANPWLWDVRGGEMPIDWFKIKKPEGMKVLERLLTDLSMDKQLELID